MRKEAKELLRTIKSAKTDEERIAVMDSVISCQNEETTEWWKTGLTEMVREFLKYYKSDELTICKKYIQQYIYYIGNLYLDLPKEERSLEMFSTIVHASLEFKDYSANSSEARYLYKRVFTDERFLMDWLVNDESELDARFMISEERSDKFILLKNIIESGFDKGKSLSIYMIIYTLKKNYDIFVGLHKRLEELLKAATVPLSKDDFKWLVKNGQIEYLYNTEHKYYAGKYHGAPDDMKPVEGWMNLLNADNPSEVSWCIKYPMKDVVAKNELHLDRYLLGKIFRFKQCQSVLYNHPAYSYAIPDMIEYAKGRINHNTLCVEFKDILGYLDE